MEYNIYISRLFDLYGELLTEKQQEYFIDYYFNNLSLQEIGDNNSVSRNAVSKSIIDTEEKLKYYEDILKLNYKCEKIKKTLKNDPKLNKVLEILE